MIDRLLRAIDTMSNLGLDGVERGGMQGEQYAEYIIDGGQDGCYVRNPIIPHPKKLGFFLETDFLVYLQGVLYCVEIKNYRGRCTNYLDHPFSKIWRNNGIAFH